MYREALEEMEVERTLYLAIPADTYEDYGQETLVQRVFRNNKIKVIIYEPTLTSTLSWLK